jgi:hypothetical protein
VMFLNESPSFRVAMASILIVGGIVITIAARKNGPAQLSPSDRKNPPEPITDSIDNNA